MSETVEFNSAGVACKGVLTRPAGTGGNVPLVIMAGGWCYTKEIVLPHYAKFFQDIGCATLCFDYRCFGESGGMPRQHIDPWSQIEDYRNALSFAETLPGIDMARSGIWGISYSGGHVLITAAIDQRPKFAIATVPVIDGFQTMRRCHGEARFVELNRAVMEDHRRRFAGHLGGYMPMSSPKPFEELSAWPFPHVHSAFIDIQRTEAPRHEHRNTIESVERLMHYNVTPFCPRIIDIPVMVTLAQGDNITSADLETEAFNAVANPNKTLVSVAGVHHMSLYTNRDHLAKVGRVQAGWLKTLLHGMS